jgi:hypothetical protein
MILPDFIAKKGARAQLVIGIAQAKFSFPCHYKFNGCAFHDRIGSPYFRIGIAFNQKIGQALFKAHAYQRNKFGFIFREADKNLSGIGDLLRKVLHN